MRHSRSLSAVGAMTLALAFVALSLPVSAGRQQATFRAGVDLISVDVQVVDGQGRPVLGLDPASFEVTIDGRRRKVVSADFLRYESSARTQSIAEMGSGPIATNQWPTSKEPERTFVVAIDAASFSAGEGVRVVRSAQAFIDRLPDTDAVGVFTLPHGSSVSPTTDRAAVRKALSLIVGEDGLRSNRYNLSPAEIIDINASPGNPYAMTQPTGRGGQQLVAPTDPNDVLRQVQLRECRGTIDQGCAASILIDAESLGRQFEQQAEESVASIKALLRLLGEYKGRKTVVLLSAGMPVSDRPGGWNSEGGEAISLGHEAARSQATIYTLHIDRGYSQMFAAEARNARGLSSSRARERELEERLLTQFAVASGGAMFSVPTGSGESALDRLLLETSSVYLLGVAPESLDLDGRTHQLKVKVVQRGTTIRSRQFVLLRPVTGS